MAQDTSTMDDAALDAVLDAQYGDDGIALDESASTENGSEDVSPSDDVEEGQSGTEEEVAHVDESSEAEEDPEDSLSTDEDEDGEDLEEGSVDDESTEATSEDDSEGDSEADEEPLAFQPLRADGKEYPIESMQELYSLASKGINADRKWNEPAAGRKMQSTMQKNGLSPEDINMLVDLKAGDPKAIASLLKSAKIDPLDIDVDALDGDYRPGDHSTNDFEVQLDDVVSRVKAQPRYDESVNVIMEKWDGQSKQAFYDNPQILELLNIDMQVDPTTGKSMYDTVIPIAEKMKALDTGVAKSDLEYYQMAGQRVISGMQKAAESKDEAGKRKQANSESKKKSINKKKKAAGPSGGTTSKKAKKSVEDMSDEELDLFLEETS